MDDIMIKSLVKVLSHPAREAIFKHLVSVETCCSCEISREVTLADSTVSRHLAELGKAGLIQRSIEATRIKYWINRKNWQLMGEPSKVLLK